MRSGATIQPSRRPGASVFDTEPAYSTRSGASPCSAPDRRAVVAVLGVVVVLEHERVRRGGPLGEQRAAGGGEDDAERELVRRGDHHRVERPVRAEPLDAQPLLVDLDRDRLEAGRAELRAAGSARGILDARSGARRGRRACARAAPSPAPSRRSRSRARGRRRRRARGPGRRRAPCAARERRADRRSRAERRGRSAARAAARRARRRAGRARRPGRRDGSRSAAGAPPRARAAPAAPGEAACATRVAPPRARHEIALGNELRVGLDDHPARHAELAREPPARGQRAARREPLVAHRARAAAPRPAPSATGARGPARSAARGSRQLVHDKEWSTGPFPQTGSIIR